MLLPVVIAFQQALAPTTPASGDTAGYWQQRADYTIVAELDEKTHTAHATGELRYVNHSPDTLRELYVHQYLNAFRPGSRWSAADEREGRVRFQALPDSAIGFERFTQVPTVDGTPVAPVYPYAPDSTVAKFTLPRALAPGDSIVVRFTWDARPSAMVFRRQGRRGRHYDFAQWYPKVAVYDRHGWEQNPLVPGGELYGEFGTFDVSLVLANDQVVGATGVPVEGDPGWERVKHGGTVDLGRDAYGPVPPGAGIRVDSTHRVVRFYARDIHHFAWSVSPDFRYEGGMYRNTIPVHVLYEPRGEKGWANGAVVEYQKHTLAWLESIYGPYAYPQLTAVMRLDGGATEYPGLVLYGQGISYGLVLHEVGHIYSYGILANNEWKSGWMDEGLTSYQSDWAENLTVPERVRGLGPPEGPPPSGYRAHAATPPSWQQEEIDLFALDLTGRAEPIGTAGQDFNEFPIYNIMIYSRAEMMYGALRNVLGDSLFRAFLHDYYGRWKFKHVDELAMRASAERVSGMQLDWFFEQWVHHTGLVDYRLRGGKSEQAGGYRHPMPVVEAGAPPRAQLDPAHLTPDWDARNNGEAAPTKFVFGWPFLDQWDRYRNVAAIEPQLWYTGPGGLTVGARARTNYQALVDKWDAGVVMAVRGPEAASLSQLQGWISVANPRPPGAERPVIGLRTGAWMVDGTLRLALSRTWDESPFRYANGPQDTLTFALNVTSPYARAWQDTSRWSNATVVDVSGEWKWRSRRPARWFARGYLVGGVAIARAGSSGYGAFGRAEAEGGATWALAAAGKLAFMFRAFGGVSQDAPAERSIGLSALDPTQTFDDNFLRGRDAILVLPDVHYVPLGGAGMRGYSLYVRMKSVVSLNAQLAYTVITPARGSMVPGLQAALFGDIANGALNDPVTPTRATFIDAGASAILRGHLYDKSYVFRLDLPVYMNHPSDATGSGAGTEQVKVRWTFSLVDLW